MKRALPLFLVPAMLVSTAAFAQGWDWGDVTSVSIWRPATLDWAIEMDPDLTEQQLEDDFQPPPAEMWCMSNSVVTDSPVDCDIHEDLVDEWLHEFLDIPMHQPLPNDLPEWPIECASACY